MDKLSMILSALFTVTLVILMAPSVLRLNQGKVLRNIALWLAICLGLALIYQNFGPGKNAQVEAPVAATEQDGTAQQDDAPTYDPANDQEFTPPRE